MFDPEKMKKIQAAAAARQEERFRKDELRKELALTYRYFRFARKGVKTSVSVGWKLADMEAGLHIVYAVALQSRRDFFSRVKARDVINEKFKNGAVVAFLAPSGIKQIDLMIGCHYNTNCYRSPEDFGFTIGIPKYLRFIPLGLQK